MEHLTHPTPDRQTADALAADVADWHETRELSLFAQSDHGTYRLACDIERNLARHVRRGDFDSTASVRAWKYWADHAARSYGTQHARPGEWFEVFPAAVRRVLAYARACEWVRHVNGHEWNDIDADAADIIREALDLED